MCRTSGSDSEVNSLWIATLGRKRIVEMPGFEPGASYMRSKRSTAELHPLSGERGI